MPRNPLEEHTRMLMELVDNTHAPTLDSPSARLPITLYFGISDVGGLVWGGYEQENLGDDCDFRFEITLGDTTMSMRELS